MATETYETFTGSPSGNPTTPTVLLTDKLVGDQTTSASNTIPDIQVGFGAPTTIGVQSITDLGGSFNITAIEMTGTVDFNGTTTGSSALYKIEAFNGVWNTLQTAAVSTNGFHTYNWSGMTTASKIRFTLQGTRTLPVPLMAVTLTDTRVTAGVTPTVPVALAANLSVDVALTGPLSLVLSPPPPPLFYTETCSPEDATIMAAICEAEEVVISITSPPARPTFTKAP